MPQSEEHDFFDQHLSKMLVAPSFEQGPPALPANAGWHPDRSQPECAEPHCRPAGMDSEASTKSSEGRQCSTQVHRHTDRHPSGAASSSGDTEGQAANAFASTNANAFASTNAAGYGGGSVPPTAPQMHAMPAPPPPAPPAQFDAMASMPAPPPTGSSSRRGVSPTPQADPMSSQVAPASKYRVGDEIEVWSNSHKRWSKGTIEKVEAGGKVSAKYASPDGAAMIKQMPENHEHLRHYVAPPQAPPAPKRAEVAPASSGGVYKVGDQIEIWSNSQNAWCRGSILKLEGELVNVKYTSGDGQAMTKLMPNGHEYLRLLEQKVVPPPPPPPGRSSHHMEGVPPPLAESAVREDSYEVMGTMIEAYDSQATSIARVDESYSSAVASGMHGGTPTASSAAPPLKTKGYRAAGSKQAHDQAQRDNDIFVAESTSWVPSGSMALCGMPIKASNKKQEVVLNDDGTPVARCMDTDRCCRCSMPIGSYFEHTCPRCAGIVCLACLDDVKYIISSYRCPCCGDQSFNQESLKQTLWYLNGYRTAQRAAQAVPVLLAGLFGYGPEGTTRRASANQSCVMEEEPQPYVQPGPPPAPKAKPPAAAKGPPPAPPRPKGAAKAAAGRGAQPSQEVPEYHTRPPANWAEGAGGWHPGQAAAGGSSDPATVAAAMHQAAANQAASRRAPEGQPAGQAQSRHRAGSSDGRAGQQQQSGGSRSQGLQAPNLFASVNNNAQLAPQRGVNPLASANGAQSPFHTRIPPDQVNASPMR